MFEVPNYLFEPSLLDEYRSWAELLAVSFLNRRWDIVGFWITNGEPLVIGGSLGHGAESKSANITWVIDRGTARDVA